MKIFTLGFTRKSAESFFTRLKRSGATALVDVRLNNLSQLAGFAKRDDLAWFTRTICGIDYRLMPQFAPTAEMLTAYRGTRGSWPAYERRFLDLLAERRIEETDPALLENACLLCSEDQPHQCHRRLVAEYLRDSWGDVEILHL